MQSERQFSCLWMRCHLYYWNAPIRCHSSEAFFLFSKTYGKSNVFCVSGKPGRKKSFLNAKLKKKKSRVPTPPPLKKQIMNCNVVPIPPINHSTLKCIRIEFSKFKSISIALIPFKYDLVNFFRDQSTSIKFVPFKSTWIHFNRLQSPSTNFTLLKSTSIALNAVKYSSIYSLFACTQIDVKSPHSTLIEFYQFEASLFDSNLLQPPSVDFYPLKSSSFDLNRLQSTEIGFNRHQCAQIYQPQWISMHSNWFQFTQIDYNGLPSIWFSFNRLQFHSMQSSGLQSIRLQSALMDFSSFYTWISSRTRIRQKFSRDIILL